MTRNARDERPEKIREGELEDDDSWLEDLAEFSDRDFGGNEDEGGPDRRRDPLRH